MALFVGTPPPTAPLPASSASPVVRKGHLALLCVAGPLDASHSEFLLERGKAMARTCRCVIVGLERSPYTDSPGARAIEALTAELDEVGAELRLVIAPGSQLEQDLAHLASDQRLRCYPTLEAACAVSTTEVH